MSNVRTFIKNRAILLGTVAALTFAGAGLVLNGGTAPASAAPSAAPAAVPVSVETVAPQSVRLWSAFSGRMKAVDYVSTPETKCISTPE